VTFFETNLEVAGVDVDECDITDPGQVERTIRSISPHVVLHAAAYADVDGCETKRDLAMAVNADGAANVAAACRAAGARLVYYSTDYVFDGDSDRPYSEEDPPDPKTVYGQSKLAGETAVRAALDDHIILRIAWLYGRHGKNFVKTMIDLGRKQRQAADSGEVSSPLRVVDDQFGNPCWTMDVARQTQAVLDGDITGLFHATSTGETTWFGLAGAVFADLGWDVTVDPCSTAEYPLPAPRPRRSSLENRRLNKLGLNVMPDWRTALDTFIRRNREGLIHGS